MLAVGTGTVLALTGSLTSGSAVSAGLTGSTTANSAAASGAVTGSFRTSAGTGVTFDGVVTANSAHASDANSLASSNTDNSGYEFALGYMDANALSGAVEESGVLVVGDEEIASSGVTVEGVSVIRDAISSGGASIFTD